MANKAFYVAEVSWVQGNLIVSGYPESVIPLGLIYTALQVVDLIVGDRIIKADPQPPAQTIFVKVVKIFCYGQALSELSEITGGHLVLEGNGLELIQQGMQLIE